LIEPAAAAAEARRGLDRVRIDDDPLLAAARAQGQAGAPILVARLDAPGQGYYLVPWQDARGILAVVQVDAESGMTSSVAALPAPLARLTMAPEEARRIASDRLGVRVVGEPALVWKACREAASPLQPLYRVAIVGGDAFVAVDGSVFRSLTPFAKGG